MDSLQDPWNTNSSCFKTPLKSSLTILVAKGRNFVCLIVFWLFGRGRRFAIPALWIAKRGEEEDWHTERQKKKNVEWCIYNYNYKLSTRKILSKAKKIRGEKWKVIKGRGSRAPNPASFKKLLWSFLSMLKNLWNSDPVRIGSRFCWYTFNYRK